MEQIAIHFTNVQGQIVYGKLWKTFDTISLRAYIGLLLYASWNIQVKPRIITELMG